MLCDVAQIQFRKATLQDVAELLQIDSVVAHDLARAQQIEQWVKQQYCEVLLLNAKISAYAVLHHHFFDQAFIEMLMVEQSLRGQGLGLKFIEHFKAIYHDVKLFTSSNASNLAMQSLLRSAGFQASGQIENLDLDDPELIFYHPVLGA